jgi:hypothetical protein
VLVTVEPRHDPNVPVINREDVMVYQVHDRAKVTGWSPLQGERAGLQLFILIDDAASTSLGSQLEDIRHLINAQPSTTAIGVAYMRNGTAEILENPTSDHTQAAKALRLPLGDPGASASPYFSVVDLIKRWPEGPVRREILMISDGIDRFGGGGPSNPYDIGGRHSQQVLRFALDRYMLSIRLEKIDDQISSIGKSGTTPQNCGMVFKGCWCIR